MSAHIPQYELDSFHRGVSNVEALFLHGDSEQTARGLGRVAAAIAHVATPDQAYAYADRRCFERELAPEDAYIAWHMLAFSDVQGAVDQMLVRSGVLEPSGASLQQGIDVADIETGNFLMDLVGVGVEKAKPLARQHIIETAARKDLLYIRPRRAYKLYQAGDSEAFHLTLSAAEEANAYHSQHPEFEPYRFGNVDTALWGLATCTIKRVKGQGIDHILPLVSEPEHRCRILAEVYEAGLSPNGQAAEEAFKIAGQLEDANWLVGEGGFDALVAGGYESAIEEYKRSFLDKATRVPDAMTKPSALAALYKGGVTAAADRLIELAEGEEPSRAFMALEDIGMHGYVYQRASRLYAENPSRALLKAMLYAKFTTKQWNNLWMLPIELVEALGGGKGMEISFRAKDVCELAEHLGDRKIHFGPQD